VVSQQAKVQQKASPFGASWESYYGEGWEVFPLPPGRKSDPPKGVTGRDGLPLSAGQCQRAAARNHNIGLRLPADLIGLDVDTHDGGHKTLAELERELGPLPPTLSSSKRGTGNRHGIHLYRVPPGLAWHDPGPGLQVIYWGWRYMVAWPSQADGTGYLWYEPDGSVLNGGEVPSPEDEAIADLPSEWAERLGQKPPTDRPRLEQSVEEGLKPGSHDTQLWELVRSAHAAGWSKDQARAIWDATLARTDRKECKRGHPDSEFERKWHHAIELHGDFPPLTPEDRADLRDLAASGVEEAKGEPGTGLQLIYAADLARPVPPVRWLAENFWPAGSHGPIGGRKKTLKSYMADAALLAVASGSCVLGNPEWPVPEPRAVAIFAGEGGVLWRQARLQRLARDLYGISDISTLPLVVLPTLVHLGSSRLAGYFRAALDGLCERHEEPFGLAVMDSLYNYHPPNVKSSDLYARGPMLARLSAVVRDAAGDDAALWVVDHFAKTSEGKLDLDSISQSGMAEFADTWLLLEHREEPDLDNGQFWLRAEFGSRQAWPGAGWEIDFSIGAYDIRTGTYDSPVKANCRRTGRAPVTRGKRKPVTPEELQKTVLDWLAEHDAATRTTHISAIAGTYGLPRDRLRDAFAALRDAGSIVYKRASVVEDGTSKVRDVPVLAPPKQKLSDQHGEQPRGNSAADHDDPDQTQDDLEK
jgi:hypothetical protein